MTSQETRRIQKHHRRHASRNGDQHKGPRRCARTLEVGSAAAGRAVEAKQQMPLNCRMNL